MIFQENSFRMSLRKDYNILFHIELKAQLVCLFVFLFIYCQPRSDLGKNSQYEGSSDCPICLRNLFHIKKWNFEAHQFLNTKEVLDIL